MSSLAESYQNFLAQTQSWYLQHNLTLQAWSADPTHPAPGQLAVLEDNQVSWQPVRQQPPADFSNVEQALELTLHPDIKQYYSLYYGAGLGASHSRGPLQLLMVWDQADVARLQENIIGHILMKRRLKQPETVFFAITDDDSIVLSVLNSTGEVYLETVGKDVKEKLASSLSDFFSQLSPAAYQGG
ncbi:SecY-interacting protein [Arsukibacterium indicum]|uniref:Protein Syd n=1 Tax=Arsukibacterium indicum TaxID=2848612 RepID=A0ABS6MJ28_9GAMM|nr:SecY-interacting protein [Arsukibacterium indicum]MBV2128237.1 SecY-interacting protein [Arsukibacterium indicum]